MVKHRAIRLRRCTRCRTEKPVEAYEFDKLGKLTGACSKCRQRTWQLKTGETRI